MSCKTPKLAWYAATLNENGKRPLVFTSKGAVPNTQPIKLPCGRCIDCRLNYSRAWAIRNMHENTLHHGESMFITLTYAPEHLPLDGSLNLDHFQRFMKRLRKKFPRKIIRFFHCGEYGEKLGRPHYHVLVYGLRFEDLTPWKKSPSGSKQYKSKTLDDLWTYGHHTIGDVTPASAGYVARYIIKKQYGEDAADHYERVDELTGEITKLKSEYVTMSRRPGIGNGWYQLYKSDLKNDYVILDGQRVRLPKYYDKLLSIDDPENYIKRHEKRINDADDRIKKDPLEYLNPDRISVKDRITMLNNIRLLRVMEQGLYEIQ